MVEEKLLAKRTHCFRPEESPLWSLAGWISEPMWTLWRRENLLILLGGNPELLGHLIRRLNITEYRIRQPILLIYKVIGLQNISRPKYSSMRLNFSKLMEIEGGFCLLAE